MPILKGLPVLCSLLVVCHQISKCLARPVPSTCPFLDTLAPCICLLRRLSPGGEGIYLCCMSVLLPVLLLVS